TALNSVLLALGYGAIGEVLRRIAPPSDLFSKQEHLLNWLLVSFFGTLTTSTFYIVTVSSEGLIASDIRLAAFLQFWVGDFVGITATMPFYWSLLLARGRLVALVGDPMTLVTGLLALAAVAATFVLGLNGQFQFFYLLFVPL